MTHKEAHQILENNNNRVPDLTEFTGSIEESIEVQIEIDSEKRWVWGYIIRENPDKSFHCYFYNRCDGWDNFHLSEMRKDQVLSAAYIN